MGFSARKALLGLAALTALSAVGCGQSSGSGSSAPDYAAALKGAPAPLAALYQRTGYGQQPAFLDGGVDGVDAEVAKLSGHPVLVNIWGSWCGPCREEFPFLQQAAAKFGDRVAFVGVDALDQPGAARTFLEEDPIPYPSFEDPGGEAKMHFDVVGLPATLIYDSKGNLAHTNQGGYASRQALFADIQRYAK